MNKNIVLALLLFWTIAINACYPFSAFAWVQDDWGTTYQGNSLLTEDNSFSMSPKEYVQTFNERNATTWEFVEEENRLNLYWDGEQMNMYLQFLDTTQPGLQWTSGIDRTRWNKLKLYIATDDVEVDGQYLATYMLWLPFLAAVLDLSFPGEQFMEEAKNAGTNQYPNFYYVDGNIKYSLQFYDDSISYGEPTTDYAVTIEMLRE